MRHLALAHRLIVLLLLGVGACAFALRAGFVPPRLSPLPAIDRSAGDAWLVDWQLSELRRQPAVCGKILREPHIAAVALADDPIRDGCGLVNGVKVARAGGADIGLGRLSCESAAALALWVEHSVQPQAQRLLGSKVANIKHFGSYACRNIRGAPWLGLIRSEHATANALDVAGFTLANGRSISILRDWRGDGPEGQFLRAVHTGACRTFRVVLGPDFNDLHRDHFHLDRGFFSRCR